MLVHQNSISEVMESTLMIKILASKVNIGQQRAYNFEYIWVYIICTLFFLQNKKLYIHVCVYIYVYIYKHLLLQGCESKIFVTVKSLNIVSEQNFEVYNEKTK